MGALEWGGVLHYGTHNGSRIGMHAARACLRVLTRDANAAFRHTWKVADQLCAGLDQMFRRKGKSVIIQRVGPMFQLMFTKESAIRNYREYCQHVDRSAYREFVHKLFEFGVYATPSAALHSIVTLAHTEQDVDLTVAAVGKALDALSGARA
jgi:glutamate-1-semialdehyde 2,1-aminomutase